MILELLTNLLNSNNLWLHAFSFWVAFGVFWGFTCAETTITVNPNKLNCDISVKWLDFLRQILKVILGTSVVIIIFTPILFAPILFSSAGIKDLHLIINLIINIIFAIFFFCGGIAVMALLRALISMMINASVNNLVAEQANRKNFKADAIKIAFLTVAFCTLLGAAFRLFLKLGNQLEWVEPIEIIAAGGVTLIPLVVIAIALVDTLVFNPKRIISNYRKSEQNLIRP